MEDYNKEELRKRRPLNYFSIVLAIIFIILAFYLLNSK